MVANMLQFRAITDHLGRFGVDSEGKSSVWVASEALACQTGRDEKTVQNLLRYVEVITVLVLTANRHLVSPLTTATMQPIW
jgi:hypothetical protein